MVSIYFPLSHLFVSIFYLEGGEKDVHNCSVPMSTWEIRSFCLLFQVTISLSSQNVIDKTRENDQEWRKQIVKWRRIIGGYLIIEHERNMYQAFIDSVFEPIEFPVANYVRMFNCFSHSTGFSFLVDLDENHVFRGGCVISKNSSEIPIDNKRFLFLIHSRRKID